MMMNFVMDLLLCVPFSFFSFSTVSFPPCRIPADDSWETKQQTDRVLEVFPSSPSTRIAFDPIKQGWGPQGHVNAFLPHNEKGSGINGGVWKVMSDYLIEGKIRNEGGESRLFRGGAGGKGKARL